MRAAERSASSPSVSRSEPAARFSARWSGSPVPGIGSTWAALQRPGQPDLGGGRAVRPGDGEHVGVLGAGGAGLAPAAGDREERHERDAEFTAAPQQRPVLAGAADAVAVLHADHRCDGPGLGELGGRSTLEMPRCADEPGIAQLGQRTEVLGDRAAPATDAAGSPRRGGRGRVGAGSPRPGRAAAPARPAHHAPEESRPGPTLVVMTRSSGYGARAAVDQLVGRAQRREVERGGVDMVDAELDRPPQHRPSDCSRSLGVPPPKAALPVSRIAPKPMRLTFMSPRSQVPASAAEVVAGVMSPGPSQAVVTVRGWCGHGLCMGGHLRR